MAENQYGFPTEVLSLPSQGLLYPEDSPLRSGTIDVKYMTAKEEDILTSTNLIQKGLVIDKLLTSVIADDKVSLDDMLIGDKNALMVGTRVLGYGPEYQVKMEDPDTGLEVEHSFNLTTLETREIDDKVFKNGNKFSFKTPKSGNTLEFRLLTHKDENDIAKEVKSYEKLTKATGVSNELTTRLKKQITSVDGDTTQSVINDFVDNKFLALDSLEFRKNLNKINPGVDMSYPFECPHCSHTQEVVVPLGTGFFWPNAS